MHLLILPIVHLLLTGVSVLVVAKLLPGIEVKNYSSAVWFAFVVAILNTIVWRLLWPLSLPFAVLTLGVGWLVINGALFLIAGRLVKGIRISGCVTAAFAALGVTIVNLIMHVVLGGWAP